MFDYAFAENGLNAYKQGKLLATESFINWMGEEKYQRLCNFILRYIADLKIPQKRFVPDSFSLKLPNSSFLYLLLRLLR